MIGTCGDEIRMSCWFRRISFHTRPVQNVYDANPNRRSVKLEVKPSRQAGSKTHPHTARGPIEWSDGDAPRFRLLPPLTARSSSASGLVRPTLISGQRAIDGRGVKREVHGHRVIGTSPIRRVIGTSRHVLRVQYGASIGVPNRMSPLVATLEVLRP